MSFVDLVRGPDLALGEIAPDLGDELATQRPRHNPVLVSGRMITLCHNPHSLSGYYPLRGSIG
jgi:hypothetical protein